MDGAMSCVKYLIFIFNFLFWVSGLAIIIVGSLIYVKIDRYDTVLNSSFTAGVVLLIVVGCIVTLIAFFGCCGACKENHCMIVTFAVLLGIIFVLELAAGITCYVYRSEIDSSAQQEFEKAWKNYNQTGYEDYSKAIDDIQHEFKCCGVNNASDWKDTPWGKQHPGSYPGTCCNESPAICPIVSPQLNNEGCYKKVKDVIENDILIIAGVGVGVAFIQIIGVAFACCLAHSIRKNYEVV